AFEMVKMHKAFPVRQQVGAVADARVVQRFQFCNNGFDIIPVDRCKSSRGCVLYPDYFHVCRLAKIRATGTDRCGLKAAFCGGWCDRAFSPAGLFAAILLCKTKRRNTCSLTEHNKRLIMANEKAILAGGCFWGMEELIRELPGVKSTRVG